MSHGSPYRFAGVDRGAAWASVVAILFAVVATISFAVDQSIIVSDIIPAMLGQPIDQ